MQYLMKLTVNPASHFEAIILQHSSHSTRYVT